MRHYGEGQGDQGEVLDDCYHVTSVLGTFCSKDYIITILSNYSGILTCLY